MAWVIPIAMTVISTFASANAAKEQQDVMAATANRDAQIADRNKRVADQDRQIATRTAELAAEDKRRENRRTYASIRAAYGTSGFELSGSPLDVLADTSVEMALDERRVEYEGQVRNREGALQMLYLQEDADGNRIASSNYKRAGKSAYGTTLLSGLTKAYNMGDAAGWGNA